MRATAKAYSELLSNQSPGGRAGKKSEETKRVSKSFVLAIVLFIVLVCQLAVRVEITQQGYTLERLRSAALKHDNVLRKVKFDYGYLASSSSLGERAKKELRMQTLKPASMRRLPSGGRTLSEQKGKL